MPVKKQSVIFLANKENNDMWKAIVIICIVNFECYYFQEEPMDYYHNYDECMIVAKEKERLLLKGYIEYGYVVEDTRTFCTEAPTV